MGPSPFLERGASPGSEGVSADSTRKGRRRLWFPQNGPRAPDGTASSHGARRAGSQAPRTAYPGGSRFLGADATSRFRKVRETTIGRGIQPAGGRVVLKTVFLEEAARLLGVSRRTIYYRIREGKLATARTPGGTQRVLVDSIAALLREEVGGASADPIASRRAPG